MNPSLWKLLPFVATVLISGCGTIHAEKDYLDVSIETLVTHPMEYRGRRVRMSGYLVEIQGANLLDPRFTYCRGGPGNTDRVYAITTLPRSVLGQVLPRKGMFEPAFSNEGRLVVVTGVFEGSAAPWPKDSIFIDPLPFPAAGPITHAKVVTMTDRTCNFHDANAASVQ